MVMAVVVSVSCWYISTAPWPYFVVTPCVLVRCNRSAMTLCVCMGQQQEHGVRVVLSVCSSCCEHVNGPVITPYLHVVWSLRVWLVLRCYKYRSVMNKAGTALMGLGKAKGKNR